MSKKAFRFGVVGLTSLLACVSCSPEAKESLLSSFEHSTELSSRYSVYTIILHAFNGNELESLTLLHSQLASQELPCPKKEGYVFDKWYLDENCTIEYDAQNLVEGENHLYAKYDAIEYVLNVHADEVYAFAFNYEDEILIDIDWASKGYFLDGYFLDEALNEEYTLGKMPSHDLDLYASLSYRERFYSFSFHTFVEEQFSDVYVEHRDLESLLLPTPQKEGYEFDSWYLDEGLSIKCTPTTIQEGRNDVYAKYIQTDLNLDGKEVVYSTNRLDLENIYSGKALNPDGQLLDFPGCHTDFIHVNYGDTVICGDHVCSQRYMRFVAAFDTKKRILPNLGSFDGTCAYKVPHGVAFVKVSLYDMNLFDDSRINISDTVLKYEPYYVEEGPIGETERRKQDYDNTYRPFSTTRASELDEASYQPLGTLNSPYFCLISDDGLEEEATYSIPMAIGKGVPMTLGLMRGSEIWEEPYLSVLRDAVDNHGFEVAQHGWTRFTEYTEDQLNCFFDQEEEYFESMGFEPKTAICPAHSISPLVSAVASQRYDALRTGYIGEPGYQYGYGWYSNGPTSNVYALDCINISVEPLIDHQAHIDAACDNNWLIIGFYHENELDAEKKAKIEAIIDYAIEKGMEFCTLSEVPHLSER